MTLVRAAQCILRCESVTQPLDVSGQSKDHSGIPLIFLRYTPARPGRSQIQARTRGAQDVQQIWQGSLPGWKRP